MTKNIHNLERLSSTEFKELISRSRDVAVESGYDHISTLHFFLADCEIRRPASIYYFAFDNDDEYRQFKARYTNYPDALPDLTQSSIPLTREAEKTIWAAVDEQKAHRQDYIFPCHLLLAAVRNERSLLYECFQHEAGIVAALTQYYTERGELNKTETPDAHQAPNAGFLASLANLFKGQ